MSYSSQSSTISPYGGSDSSSTSSKIGIGVQSSPKPNGPYRLSIDGQDGQVALVPLALPHTTQFLARLLLADESHGSKLDHVGPTGKNALHFAIESRDANLVKFALDNGADPNMRASNGHTPLHIAAKSGNGQMAELLLEHKADPNTVLDWGVFQRGGLVDSTHPTPLYIASIEGNKEVAEALINCNAEVNYADPISFWTPLLVAVECGHAEIVSLLLAKGARVDGDSRAATNPLLQAVFKQRIDMVQILFCCGADLNRLDVDGEPAIHTAALNGYLEIVKFLIGVADGGLDVIGRSGQLAWWYAHRAGHGEIVDMLKQTMRIVHSDLHEACPPDLADDTYTPIETIGRSKMVEDIATAQKYIYSVQNPSNVNSWKSRVRFLIQGDAQEEYDFEVIEPYVNNQDDREPFIAISYCWGSQNRSSERQYWIKAPQSSGSGAIIRSTQAPPELIQRSLSFAHSKGIQRVWIDQECIHQDNPEDKRILLGAMHHIYRQATFTVAMLGKHVQSLEDMEALIDEVRDKYEESPDRPYDLYLKHPSIVSGRLLKDKWFSRSWTLQESLSASTHTDNLVYLVEWGADFDQSGSVWVKMASSLSAGFPRQTVPRNFIIDWTPMLNMSFGPSASPLDPLLAFIQDSHKPRETFTLSDNDIDRHTWYKNGSGQSKPLISTLSGILRSLGSALWSSPATAASRRCDKNYADYKQDLNDNKFAEHYTMSITTALFALRGKRNTIVSDRLSILANLTSYEYHLDVVTLVKERPSTSFSACLLALCLANGDVSPLTDSGPFRSADEPKPEAPTWIPTGWAASWGGELPQHVMEGRMNGGGNPCVVINDMLVIRGIVWDIQPYNGLLPLQEAIRNCLGLCRLNASESHLIGLKVFQATLRHLFQHGMDHLVELFMSIAIRDHGRIWKSPSDYHETMNQLRSWYHGKEAWPSQAWGSNPWSDKPTNSFKSFHELEVIASKDFTVSSGATPVGDEGLDKIPDSWGPSLLRWIYLTVANGAPLPLGRCGTSDGETQELAIFRINLEVSTMAFVPLVELDYEFSERLLPQSARRWWQVRSTQDNIVCEEDISLARNRLAALNANGLSFSNSRLRIQHQQGLEGCWSPLLCSKGILYWDSHKRSYSMTPLGLRAPYYFIT